MEKRIYIDGFDTWGDAAGTKSWESRSVRGQFGPEDRSDYYEDDEEKPAPPVNPVPEVEPEYVYAHYWTGSYEGSALVVYKQGDQWFSVNASHCSCYGLEDQWTPEPFDPALYLRGETDGKLTIWVPGEYDYSEPSETPPEGSTRANQAKFTAWLREALNGHS